MSSSIARPIGHHNIVPVGILPVDEVGVWPPDPGQRLPVEGELLHPEAKFSRNYEVDADISVEATAESGLLATDLSVLWKASLGSVQYCRK